MPENAEAVLGLFEGWELPREQHEPPPLVAVTPRIEYKRWRGGRPDEIVLIRSEPEESHAVTVRFSPEEWRVITNRLRDEGMALVAAAAAEWREAAYRWIDRLAPGTSHAAQLPQWSRAGAPAAPVSAAAGIPGGTGPDLPPEVRRSVAILERWMTGELNRPETLFPAAPDWAALRTALNQTKGTP